MSSLLLSLVLSLSLLCVIVITAQPSNGDVRLVNSTGNPVLIQGSLEIYLSANDTWGTVCVNKVTSELANTVCRQLGFYNAISHSSNESSNFFPVKPPLLKDVTCDGEYLHILQCNYPRFSITDAMEDICEDGTVIPFIICNHTSLASSPYEGQLALFNGEWSSQGVLQIYLNREWGNICLDFFTSSVGDVACRQLGYTNSINHGKYTNNSLIWLRHVNCSDSSRCFRDCYTAPTIKNIYCSNTNVVFLTCTFNVSKHDPNQQSREMCELEYKNLDLVVVVILMILFCVIVLVYIFIFLARVGVAAYHKTDRYKLKESERRHHFKDVYHSALDRNSLMIDEPVTSD